MTAIVTFLTSHAILLPDVTQLLLAFISLFTVCLVTLLSFVYRSNNRILNGHEARLNSHEDHILHCTSDNQGFKVELEYLKEAADANRSSLREIHNVLYACKSLLESGKGD